MQTILAPYSVSISELKKNPSALLEASEGSAIAILNHNRPTAYLVPSETYEALLDLLENYELGQIVKERQQEKSKAIKVSIDEL